MAIAATLSAIALPSFARLLAETRVAEASNDLFGAVLLVRSEALKRHRRVVMCTSADAVDCAQDIGWHSGWIVFEDPNENGKRDGDESLLQVGQARPGQVRMTGTDKLGNYVSYVASGRTEQLSGAYLMGTLTICSEGVAKKIVINHAGRPRLAGASC
nr:GspH/FimT family pseudopilin [Aromatoleum diolicum]